MGLGPVGAEQGADWRMRNSFLRRLPCSSGEGGKGEGRRRYRLADYRTPCEKLLSLNDVFH